MKRLTFGGVLCAWLVLTLAGPAGAQPPFAWWKSEQFRKDLGLTAEQATRIENVFQATVPQLRQSKEELDRQEADLSRLIEANADEAKVSRQLDQVEATRGNLNKMRTLMLLHQREVLSSEQRVKFKALHQQWDRNRRARPHEGDDDSRQHKN
jgi:Spy/CpxP family protein refolding chaperone